MMDNLKNFFSGPRIIFAILGLIVLVEVIYAARVLTSPDQPPPPAPQMAVEQAVSKISLNAPKTTVAANEVIAVSVLVNSGEKAINGVDLIVRFDPQVWQVSSADIIEGEIFDEYPLKAVDGTAGTISISGISGVGKTFKGAGQFAMINLRAKKVGQTTLTVEFERGTTTSTNLVEAATSQNILEQVDNLEINIQ